MGARRWLPWSPLIVLVAALAGGEASGWFFLRTPIEAALAARLGRDVQLAAPFRLHVRDTIRVSLGGLRISAPAAYDVPYVVDARGITLSLNYADLLALRHADRPLHIAALAADAIDVKLIRLADGSASWQFATASLRPPPSATYLGIRSGQITVRDAVLAANVDARITSGTAGSPATAAELSGQFRGRALRAAVTLPNGLPPALPGTDAEPIAAQGEGDYGDLHLSFDGAIGIDSLHGKVSIRGPSLAVLAHLLDTTLPTTAPFSLQADIDRKARSGDASIWHVAVTRAIVGKSELSGRFFYDAGRQPPRLEGELDGRRFILADLAPAFGTRDANGQVVRPARGRTLPDRRLDLPSLTRLDADIAVDLAQVDLGSAFRQPIAPFRGKLTLDGGRMQLADIDARTAQGHLTGALAIDAREARPEWRADLVWDDVRLDSWLMAARSGASDIRRKTAADSPPSWFAGRLHGRTRLVGHGQSVAELLGSLNGRATFFVRNGSLSHLALEAMGLDIAQGLGLLLTGDDRQPLECAIADLEARNGIVTPRVGVLATPVTVILVDGNLDFANEQLNLRLVAKPQNVSPLTLRSPFHINGSFADPRLTPDATPIAARVIGALGLALINPLASILPFVDLGDRDTAACGDSLAGRAAKPPQSREHPVLPGKAPSDKGG